MPRICIQPGHVNIKYNIDPNLRKGTGAPGEANFTLDVVNQVSAELRKRGCEVKQTDANGNSDPDVTNVDWDLFLAIHYDADIYNKGGGFIAAPDLSADLNNGQSLVLASKIGELYFPTTGVIQYPQRQNPNTKFYYMWGALSENTPCVLLECGVGQHKPDDWELLQNNRAKVVEGIVRGVCNAFGLLYEIPAPPIDTPLPPIDNPLPPVSDSELVKQLKLIRDAILNILKLLAGK